MIKPLLDNILAEAIEENVSAAGIALPDEGQKRESGKAKVIEAGEGIRTTNGKFLPLLVKKEDIILFSRCAPITIDGKNLLIIKEEWVLAIINGK